MMSKRKAPDDGNKNQVFCDFLLELANFEKSICKNIYKYNAYRKAADALAAHPTRITSGDEAKQLNGVGDKIAKKIDEYLDTGKLRKIENIQKDEKSVAMNLLTRVTGIGPAKAETLYEFGIKTIDELKKHTHRLNHHQNIGLKYFDDFEKKIPRKEIEDIEKVIKKEMETLDPQYTITICGSYRREKLESGDIDTLITHPSYTSDKSKKNGMLKSIVDTLESHLLITDTLSLGDTKFMGACRLNNDLPTRRLDIRLIPYDQYYCGILYFTGSDSFNKSMRLQALKKGFTLNEYSLRPVGSTGVLGEAVEISSERDVFEYIGYSYEEPKDRY